MGRKSKKAERPAVAGDNMKKQEALNRALQYIERQHGIGTIMKLNDHLKMAVPAIPTGALSLDQALGVGGMPRGRIAEIFGPESSGKTTLALHIAANAQKHGGVVAYIDAEHALDPIYARNIGVNIDEILISQPSYGEQALEVADTLVRSNAVSVIVIDSVAALVPKAELDGEMIDMQVGLQARLMSKALRKLSASVSSSNTLLIFINQLREKIGVMFGNPETTPGGRALKFYASVRIDVRRIGSIKAADSTIGNVVRAKVVKNKVAPPFRMAEFEIMFNEGISFEGTLIDLGIQYKIIDRAGAWFSYGTTRLGQGRENVRAYLKANPDITAEIEEKIRVEAEITPLDDVADTASDTGATDTSARVGEE